MIVTRPGDGTDDGGIFMEPAASAERITSRQLRIKSLRIHAQICGEGDAPVITSFLDGDKPDPAAR